VEDRSKSKHKLKHELRENIFATVGMLQQWKCLMGLGGGEVKENNIKTYFIFVRRWHNEMH
jgi:hypothetical protein